MEDKVNENSYFDGYDFDPEKYIKRKEISKDITDVTDGYPNAYLMDMSPLMYLRTYHGDALKSMTVEYVFYSKLYEEFVDFCVSKGVICFYDLSDEIIEEFSILPSEIRSKNKNIFQITNKISEMEEAFHEDFFELEYLKMHHKKLIQETDIESVFNERKFLLFNEYCKSQGIETMDQIDSNVLVCFGFGKNVGKKKRKEVSQRIETFLVKSINENEKGCIYNYIKSTYPEDLEDKKIDDVFKESKYIIFRMYCNDKSVHNLYDLDLSAQKKFFNLYDIRESKKKAFLDILKREYISIIRKNIVLNKGVRTSSFVVDDEERRELEKKYFKLVEIDDMFDSDYKAFEYMHKKLNEDGIYNLYDLINYDLTKLKKLSGVGDKRYSEFKMLLEKKIYDSNEIVNIISRDTFILDEVILPVVSEKTIREVMVDLGLGDVRKAYGLDEISKYNGMKYKEIEDGSLIKNLMDLKSNLEKIVNINDTVSKLRINDYSSEYKEVFENVIKGQMSEEEFAKSFNKNIDEVRAIDREIIDNINKILEDNRFSIAIRILYHDYRNMDLEKLKEFISKENEVIIDIIKANIVPGIFYNEENNTMSYFEIYGILNSIKKEFKKAPKFGPVSILNDILKKYRDIDVSDNMFAEFAKKGEYVRILERNGIKLIDNFYYKTSISKIGLFEFYLKYYHVQPFRVNKENVDKYNDFLSRLGLDFKANMRSIDGVKVRSKKLILTHARTYSHIDLVGVDEVTQLHMKNILDLRLSKKNCINASELYNIMIDYYPEDFYSKHHVYSLVDYYFDDYTTSSGNSLDIAKKGNEILAKTDEIYDLCKQFGSIAEIKEIRHLTNWSLNRVHNAIDNSENVIKLGPSKCAIIEDILDDDIKANFRNCVNEAFTDGYCFTCRLFEDYMMNNDVLREFVNKYEIEQFKEVASIVKYLCEDIIGNNNFLYREDSKVTSLEDVIALTFNTSFTRQELIDFLEKNGYSKVSLYQTLDRLIEKKLFVRVSIDEYESINEFNIHPKLVKNVIDFADNKISENKYFVPEKHIDEMENIVSTDKYNLNQFLVASILELEGYKRLFRHRKRNGDEIHVMVNKDSKYNDIDVLAHHLISNGFDGDMEEKNIYDYLVKMGIYRSVKDASHKKLQKEMYINGCISIDDEGMVVLH